MISVHRDLPLNAMKYCYVWCLIWIKLCNWVWRGSARSFATIGFCNVFITRPSLTRALSNPIEWPTKLCVSFEFCRHLRHNTRATEGFQEQRIITPVHSEHKKCTMSPRPLQTYCISLCSYRSKCRRFKICVAHQYAAHTRKCKKSWLIPWCRF